VLLFAAWSTTYYTPSQLTPTLAFASFFFVLFALAPFTGRKPLSRNHAGVVAIIALLNSLAYFTACYLMMDRDYRIELVWIMIASGALHFGLSLRLRSLESGDRPLAHPLYLAIAIGFLTVAIPIRLERQWLDLGWLVEAGALFWAAHRARMPMLRWFGVVALALGVEHLISVDSAARQSLIFNPRFGLYLAAIAALAVLAYYAVAEGGELNRQWAAGAILALNALALVALHFEVTDYFQPVAGYGITPSDWRALNTARDFTYSAVWMVYGGGLMLIGFWKRSAFLRWQAIVLLAATAAKVFFYDISALERGYRIVAFIVLGAILLAVSFFYQRSRKTVEP